eukprot:TRINITY_DN6013_c0_g1_i1.p1 TRINITY_DN6013_c0_g1~~TRINITY_DN6013_c0_g1_i1.p1  ORF type:complete len:279 (-),score=32.53 TRINITY_DN6013_c0_g1_i1:86-922(-)
MAADLFCCFRRNKGIGASNNNNKTETSKVHNNNNSSNGNSEGAVLVELFTSQGCKTSPTADLLMSKIGNGDTQDLGLDVQVIVLAYHVEFWDYLGWKDPFASTLWSARQRSYCEALKLESIYTPQLIVQGRSQCLASNSDEVLDLIRCAPRFPLSEFKTSCSKPSEKSLQVSLSGQLRFKVNDYDLDILVALHESGQVTECTKGENNGCVLQNDFIVRGLEKVCTVKNISARKTVSGKVVFNIWEGFSISKCGLVMFFQKSSTMEIQGVLPLNLPESI